MVSTLGKVDAAELYVTNNNSANSRMATVGPFLSHFQMTLSTEATLNKSRVQAQDKFELGFNSLLVTQSGMILMPKSKVKAARKTVFMEHVFDKNE